MSERQQRISQLLHDLRGEVTDAIRNGEIDGLSFWFYVMSQYDAQATFCAFRTDLVPILDLDVSDLQPVMHIKTATSQDCRDVASKPRPARPRADALAPQPS